MKIKVAPDRNFKDFQNKVVKTLGKRINALKSASVYMATEMVFRDIHEKLPSDSQYDSYRESLRVVQISGTNGTGFAIIATPKRTKLKQEKDTKTLLRIVGNRRRLKGVPGKIRVLEKYSPWTVDTIPFMPDKKDAMIISQQVSGRQAARVSKAREQERKMWRSELLKFGVSVASKKKVTRGPGRLSTIPDLYYTASRLEFGLNGTQPKAHWRPSLMRLGSQGSNLITKHKMFASTLDSRYKGWKNWPPSDISEIDTRTVKKLENFHKLLGI